ncbi:MAG: hypothetical protein IJZ63_05210, partial [Clostridia bacterium]|nr:hypothetical protein [Clostridia bacterium]
MRIIKKLSIILLAMIIFAFSLPTATVFAADDEMHYGRTKLSGDSLYFYDEISNGCKAANKEIKIDLNGHNIDYDKDLNNIIDHFYSDHPEYFWFTGSCNAIFYDD